MSGCTENPSSEIRTRGRVIERRNLTHTIYLLRLHCDHFAPARAGQFVNLSVPGFFLRRPLAIADLTRFADGSADVTVIVARVGGGTRALGDVAIGSEISLLGPLGNGFDVDGVVAGEEPLLVGGGSGIPPLYELAKALVAKGAKPRVFLGFRDAPAVYFDAEFAALGCQVTVATEDATGFVTDALPATAEHVYACGPNGMLRSVKNWAKTATNAEGERPRIQLSLEAHMGCGFGACLGCTIPTVRGLERVCLEGPVFCGDDVLIDDEEVIA